MFQSEYIEELADASFTNELAFDECLFDDWCQGLSLYEVIDRQINRVRDRLYEYHLYVQPVEHLYDEDIQPEVQDLILGATV